MSREDALHSWTDSWVSDIASDGKWGINISHGISHLETRIHHLTLETVRPTDGLEAYCLTIGLFKFLMSKHAYPNNEGPGQVI